MASTPTLLAALELLLGECNWEREGHSVGTRAAVQAIAAHRCAIDIPVAGLLAAALVDAGMTGTAAEATALQLLQDFHVKPRQ